MKLVLISNPASGRSKKEKIERAVEILRDGGAHEVLLRWTEKARDGTRLAREAAGQGADAIIAAGGDGTVNEVLNGLAGTPTPMGVIPLGTANCYALEVGIPLDAGQAAKAILDSERMSISLGKTGETLFLLMAGIGYDAEVVHRLEEDALSWKRKLGKADLSVDWPDAPGGLSSAAASRYHGGGETVARRYSVIIGNARSMEGIHVTPLADLAERRWMYASFSKRISDRCFGTAGAFFEAESIFDFETSSTGSAGRSGSKATNRLPCNWTETAYGILPRLSSWRPGRCRS
jgi:hypothetical protein